MNELTAFEREAAKAALEKMFRDGHFSICTVDKVCKITGAIPDRREYAALNAMHCVHWADMSLELRQETASATLRAVSAESFGVELSTLFVEDLPSSSRGLKWPKFLSD